MRFPNIKKSKREIVKFVADNVVDYGTALVLYHVINNNIIKPRRLHNKIAIAAFSYAIGAALSKAGNEHTNKLIDTVFDAFDDIKKAVDENRLESY